MKRVRLTPNKQQKFVLVSVTEGDRDVDVLWGNPEATWHIDIVHELTDLGHTVTKVAGGGRAHLDHKKRAVYFWDKSTRYGAPPAEVVAALLTEAYPDHRVYAEMPSLAEGKVGDA